MGRLISELFPTSLTDIASTVKSVTICQVCNKKVNKTAKLNLTKLYAEAVRLEGKSKPSFESPPKPRRK